MRAFISHAQTFDPIIPPDLHNYIVAKYVEKRKLQREGLDEQSYMYVTPRTLLAIIRLAQSMAKLNFRNQVKQGDIDEAIKLMDFSIRSLRNMKSGGDSKKRRNFPFNHNDIERDNKASDRMSQVINAIREVMSVANTQQMNINELLKKIQKGPTSTLKIQREDLTDVLDYYKKMQVVYVDTDENVIFL